LPGWVCPLPRPKTARPAAAADRHTRPGAGIIVTMSGQPTDPDRLSPELQLTEERFNDLLRLTADWLWEQDAELRFSWFSSNYSQGGADHKSYVGVKRWDLPLEVPADVLAEHQAQLAAHQPFRDLEYRITTLDGKKRWYSISGLPLFAQGVFTGYRGTGREITQRKMLEEELQRQLARFGDLVELSADWVWEQDADLRFTYFSSGLERSGVGMNQYLGLQRWDLPIDFTPAQWEEHKALLRAHQPFRNIQYRVRRADGDYNWFENSGVPVFEDGQFVGYRGIGRDITPRKRMEAELLRHRDHLAEMVDSQTADLLRAKEAAERANQSKSEFLSNMSHELRTPLHAVLAFARLGLMRIGSGDAEKLKEYFELIRASGNTLLEMVEQLLDLSKLETGNAYFSLAAVDLRQRVEAVQGELSALLESKQLTLSMHDEANGACVLGDAKRIDQLLRNLIGNAIKFAPAQSAIEVGIAPATLPRGRRQGDIGVQPAVQLVVADAGIGIPEAELETIFEKFTQSSRTRDGAGGSGLGLAICREIVQAHRGMIRAVNRQEGGAAFEVLLPQASQSPA
jgi:PAS domain S-box-containing protein